MNGTRRRCRKLTIPKNCERRTRPGWRCGRYRDLKPLVTGPIEDGSQPQWFCPKHHQEAVAERGLPIQAAKSLKLIDGVWTPVPYVPHTQAGVA